MVERPLDGDLVYSLKITGHPAILAKRRYALELSLRERVMTYNVGRAGVAGYRLFEARNNTPAPPTLAEAITQNPYSQPFLLSVAGSGLCLVTSRIGYALSQPVEVSRTNQDSPEILLYDVSDGVSDDSLIARHLERMKMIGADPDLFLPQHTADIFFRDMVSRAPEMP